MSAILPGDAIEFFGGVEGGRSLITKNAGQ